jgi:hypothetical protein
MKEAGDEEAELAFHLATEILKAFQQSRLKPEIAYAVLGDAFSRMHVGLGKNEEEWLEVTKLMATHLKC